MKVFVVEDSYEDINSIRDFLALEFDGVNIQDVGTEKRFRNDLPAIAADPPDVFIIDVMMRWSDLQEADEDKPAEVLADGYYRAGMRCYAQLRTHPSLANVPVIFFTSLHHYDVGYDQIKDRNAMMIRKQEGLDGLATAIRSALSPRMELPSPKQSSLGKRIKENAALSLGGFGVSVDMPLKSVFSKRRKKR